MYQSKCASKWIREFRKKLKASKKVILKEPHTEFITCSQSHSILSFNKIVPYKGVWGGGNQHFFSWTIFSVFVNMNFTIWI